MEVRVDWHEHLKRDERSEFVDGVHTLLDPPRGLSMAEVCRMVRVEGTTSLKAMLAGAPIPRRHLLYLRGALTVHAQGPDAAGAGFLPVVAAETAWTTTAASDRTPREPSGTGEFPARPEAAPLGGSNPVADSGLSLATAPGGPAPPGPSVAAGSLPIPERTREGFAVLAYWLRTVRRLGRDEIARGAGLAGAASLLPAVRGIISPARVDQLYTYVSALGVDPGSVIDAHRAEVPATEMPVALSEDAPADPSDSPERKEFVRTVQRLRQAPWAKEWRWFDRIMGYRGRQHTHRMYCTPLAVPDKKRLAKLRRELKALRREQAAQASAPQLLLVDTVPAPRPDSAPVGPIAAGADGLGYFAEGENSVPGCPRCSEVQATGAPALTDLFDGAVLDLEAACEKLDRIAHALPPIAAAAVGELRDRLLEQIPRIRPPR